MRGAIIIGLIFCMSLSSTASVRQKSPHPPASHSEKVDGSDVIASSSQPSPESQPKYLIEIYPATPSLHSSPNSLAEHGDRGQSISFDSIPPKIYFGEPFPVKAKSDSGLPVTLEVLSGPERIVNSVVTLTGPGKLVLRASQPGNAAYRPAPTLNTTFEILEDDDYCYPGMLPQNPLPDKTSTGNVGAVIAWLGNPVPFSFEPFGQDKIAIYSLRPRTRLSSSDEKELKGIERRIDELKQQKDLVPPPGTFASTRSSKADSGYPSCPPQTNFCMELSIPHASALGDVTTKMNALNSNLFTIQGFGTDKIRISSKAMPSCHDLTVFLKDVRHVAWQPYSESPVAQEYHLQSPPDVIKAFGGSAAPTGNSTGTKDRSATSADSTSSSQAQSSSGGGRRRQ